MWQREKKKVDKLLILRQFYTMIYARGEFVFIVRHHDEGLLALAHVVVDHALRTQAVHIVETMEGLVKDKEVGTLDKGSHKEYEALLAR